MKKTDLAYTAGIIDGEGCIMIRKNPRKKRKRPFEYTLYVTVASTDQWLPQWLRFAWGGNVASHWRSLSRFRQWEWQLGSKKASIMLQTILPYLHLKRPQAELAIKFQQAKFPRGRGHDKTAEELAVEEAQYILMRNLKRTSKERR